VKPRIAISIGDPSGIGPEVVAAALADRRVKRTLSPLVVGDAAHPGVTHIASRLPASACKPGVASVAGGRAQLAYVDAAIDLAKAGEADGLCTAPVSKEAISKSGVVFTGHTERLAAAFGCDVVMLMAGPRLSVALATNHLALRDVPQALTVAGLLRVLRITHEGLKRSLGRRPSIAVCGLNPHASDGGVMGDEEARVITPAIRRARRAGLDVSGPFAADGLFAKASRGFPFDVAVAMFHDQGLVATKTLDFVHTVNVTLGLPVPRTSPDHGVAYDLAGTGRADPEPMIQSLLKCARLVQSGR
jgi:4-hydroxythreonine-4-phosphate dehydrogenase